MSDNPLAEWLRARERDHRRDRDDDTGPHLQRESEGPAVAGSASPAEIRPPAAPWDDQPEEPTRPRRRLTVFAVALVPWVIAGVALTAALRPTGENGPPTGKESPPAAQEGPPAAPESPASPVPPGHAVAAVLAVRAGLPTALDGPGEGQPPLRRYVDLAVAEASTPTSAGDVAVVTVAATVLEGTAEQWQRARPARFAVAVRDTEDGPVALGRPWALPGPPSAPREAEWSETDADAEAVEAALLAAGYTRVRELGLSRSDALPGVLRAECRAVAPGETSMRPHAVWVADEPTPAVLGLPPAGGGQGAVNVEQPTS